MAASRQPGSPRQVGPAGTRHDGDLSPFPDGRPPPSIHGVFAGDEVALDISFAAARVRLASLIRGGLVDCASARACSGEVTGLAGVDPPRSVPGLPAAVRVYVRELKATSDSARFALRWEMAGPGGGLFPALDADITLAAAGEHAAVLALAGVYRSSLGVAGAAWDRAVMRGVATATIGAFLGQIAEAIAHPAGGAGPGADPPLRPPEPDML